MLRRIAVALLATAFAGAAVADDGVKKDVKDAAKATKREVKNDVKGAFHDADGVVKSVSGSGFVVTDEKGQELSFEVNTGTVVRASGATHKMNALRADGKPAQLSEFLSQGQRVSVRYSKPEDRMVAKDIRVKP